VRARAETFVSPPYLHICLTIISVRLFHVESLSNIGTILPNSEVSQLSGDTPLCFVADFRFISRDASTTLIKRTLLYRSQLISRISRYKFVRMYSLNTRLIHPTLISSRGNPLIPELSSALDGRLDRSLSSVQKFNKRK